MTKRSFDVIESGGQLGEMTSLPDHPVALLMDQDAYNLLLQLDGGHLLKPFERQGIPIIFRPRTALALIS